MFQDFLGFSDFQKNIKTPPPKKSLKTLGDTNCFGPTRFSPPKNKIKDKTVPHFRCPVVSGILEVLDFRNREI